MFSEIEEAFPSPLERTVASALLLLSIAPVSLSPPKSLSIECKISISESLPMSNSKLCSSSLTSDDGSSAVIRDRQLKVFALVARFHEMKLKVVRKSRSKNFRNSDHRKINSGKAAMMSSGSVSETSEASSCLSSGSSARSCINAVSRIGRRESLAHSMMSKTSAGTGFLGRRAEAILRLLSGGCASEVRIRQLLGDSPDTSKALRMLLKLEEVKRSGAGGRRDPFIYKIAC